jgi:hypothetical protein
LQPAAPLAGRRANGLPDLAAAAKGENAAGVIAFFKAPIRQRRVSRAGAAQLEKDAKT